MQNITEAKYAETKGDNGSLTIKLQHPPTFVTGDVITEVTLSRMKQGEMKRLRKQYKDNSDFGDAMLAQSMGINIEDLGQLDMEDYNYLSDRFSSMVGFGTRKYTE